MPKNGGGLKPLSSDGQEGWLSAQSWDGLNGEQVTSHFRGDIARKGGEVEDQAKRQAELLKLESAALSLQRCPHRDVAHTRTPAPCGHGGCSSHPERFRWLHCWQK